MSLATLTTAILSSLQKLSERLSARRAPAGYRPGVTLEYVRRNLGLASFTATGPASGVFFLGQGGLAINVVERTQAQLLMHLVMTHFTLTVPASEQSVSRFELHHSGSIRRTGLAYRQRSGEPLLSARLKAQIEGDQALYQSLMRLDFKSLHIDMHGQHWHVRLEHMGGSEVVNRMPAFRRYIALSAEQRALLLRVLGDFERVLHGF